MSVRSRVAFASGVAGIVGATLLLAGRFGGSAVAVLLLVWVARAAPAASLLDAGPVIAADAARALRLLTSYAPAWALIVATGVVRAGSGMLIDVRGANAVAGPAIARGELATVVGAWLAIVAGVLATAAWTRAGVETAGPAGSVGRISMPSATLRLALLGALAQLALLTALFVGPQVTSAREVIWWGGAIVALAGAAWFARGLANDSRAPAFATALAGAGLALALIGGAP